MGEVPEVCPECGGDIFYDPDTGEYICTRCGLIVAKRVKGLVTPQPLPPYSKPLPAEKMYYIRPEVQQRRLSKSEWWTG